VKIYVAAVEALRKKERGDETQFTTKIGGKLVWVPVISFSGTQLMPYYAQTGPFSPPNRLTLPIPFLHKSSQSEPAPMVCGQETLFHCVALSNVTRVGSHVLTIHVHLSTW